MHTNKEDDTWESSLGNCMYSETARIKDKDIKTQSVDIYHILNGLCEMSSSREEKDLGDGRE